MLKDYDTQVAGGGKPRSGDALFEPVEFVTGDDKAGLLILCDHASSEIPSEYGDLGVGSAALARHISYDIGARSLTLALAEHLNAPALMSRFSRLVIDPNRGEDDPTLIMRISDRVKISGNELIDSAERTRRLDCFYRPYHQAIEDKLAVMTEGDRMPVILSIHSFTHHWRGIDRPWHAGILWDKDPRIAVPLIEGLRAHENLVIGDNEPYKGILKGDTMHRHGTVHGFTHGLVEVRQDLISTPGGVEEWADRLALIMKDIMVRDDVRRKVLFGSHSDI